MGARPGDLDPGVILCLLDDTISAAASRCRVRVIATNENLMVARHTARLIF